MTLEKRFKRLLPLDYPKGYSVSVLPSHKLTRAFFSTASIKTVYPEIFLTQSIAPNRIILRTYLKTFFIIHQHQAVLAKDQLKTPLYESNDPFYKDCQHTHIDLMATNHGCMIQQCDNEAFIPITLTENSPWKFYFEGDCLYRHSFATTSKSIPVDKQQTSTILIYPYGGFYRPGCALTDIKQMVFSIVSDRNSPTHKDQDICIEPLADFINMGASPSITGPQKLYNHQTIQFIEPNTCYPSSFEDVLSNGSAVFQLEHTHLGKTYHTKYVSERVLSEQNTFFIDVIFKKETKE